MISPWTIGVTSELTSLSLVCEENLGSGILTDEHAGQPLAHVLAGELDLLAFDDAGVLGDSC